MKHTFTAERRFKAMAQTFDRNAQYLKRGSEDSDKLNEMLGCKEACHS